ncbi:shikimate kinase [Streptococcus australis]|uniref:Shikimate kinase n=1 Tax=Streptococcus australis ATCC 700641 TaxID=888833 RepID=E7SAG1_9STRE|nr:shikimate kinase [Streptococcus australis]EFV99070.1 shikimate kinase [Streptococcus australis ATCC 700641]EGU65629.1 shikimate kinase [Streptococcus australis ATCC 700641]SQH66624.1 shikimate kinase [Streptococcus australis]
MPKILLGFMGAGKTTISRLLDPAFADMDALLVRRLEMPIVDYFTRYGEESFRLQESLLLQELLNQESSVIATGGGIVLKPENRELLKKNPCNIYLRIDFDHLYQRLATDPVTKRPLFLDKSQEEFRTLYEQRLPLYEEVATHVIDVADKTPEEIVEMIQ